MRVNFITNLGLQEVSGGFSAMNAAAHEALTEIADVHYVGPINPRVSFCGWMVAKLQRSVGQPSKFFFFSEARLRLIAEEVNRRRRADADIDFFHGFTPWVRCRPASPYVAWSDCCFRDYLDIYHPARLFDAADVMRICSTEAEWMRGAHVIVLSSEWARLRSKTHYGLSEELLANVSIFGAMDIPEKDTYTGGRDFVFVSTDYARKNGPLCRQAMNRVWQKFPDARLKIIGAPPHAADLSDNRVIYEGYFDKSKPKQLAAFTNHLSRAFALVHPTEADTTAMIVIEAAFHGCPSITPNDFALPEVTRNGSYAILLRRPISADALADAMIGLLADEERYRALRARARQSTIPQFSRVAFKKRLQDKVLGAAANAAVIRP